MEPRGCNWWQSVANRIGAEAAKSSQTVAVGCHRLPNGAHGKEGVSGSSPEEGFVKCLQIATLLLSVRRTRGHILDTSAVRATHRDGSRRLLTQPSWRDTIASIAEVPAKMRRPLSELARERPPLYREGVAVLPPPYHRKPTSYTTSWELTECPSLKLEARPRRQDTRVCAASCTDAGTSRGRPGSLVASTAASHAAAAASANSVA